MSYDCYCDYDAPQWISIRNVKAARKPHVCEECRAPILPGEPYEYTSGKWDYHDTFHICTRCVELREWAKISVPCFCWAYGNLHEDVRNMVDEVRHDVPGFLFEWGRRMVKIKQEKQRRTSAHSPPHQSSEAK